MKRKFPKQGRTDAVDMSETHKPYASIEDRIMQALDDLTASERKLATTVLEVKGALATFTASEIAEKAGTSQATAVRFFRRLGYESFSELKHEARQSAGWASPLYQISGTGHVRMAAGDFGLHTAQDLKNLTQTAETVPQEALDAAVGMLAGAGRIFVVGFRNSAVLASYARNLLALLHDDVVLLPYAGMSIAESLIGLRGGDVLLAFGFRRRPVALNAVLQVAQEAGAKRILIADPTVTVSARLADVSLRCANRSAGLFDSYAAAMSLINYLCTQIADRGGDAVIARLERFEHLHDEIDGAGAQGWSAE